MKKLLLITILTLTGYCCALATDYENAIRKGIDMLQSSQGVSASVSAVHYFERLSEMNKTEWLPLYYAAYGSLKAGLQEENQEAKDDYYRKGLAFIGRAKAIRENESEIYAMEGYITLMYISNDAMKRAPSQTADAMAILEKAKALNPANPRPWFIHGQNTLFTPAFFGGGENNAKPLLQKAVALYQSFQPENDLMPVWGRERCEKLLEKCR